MPWILRWSPRLTDPKGNDDWLPLLLQTAALGLRAYADNPPPDAARRGSDLAVTAGELNAGAGVGSGTRANRYWPRSISVHWTLIWT